VALVLGINCFHADAAAALVRDGHVVAAVEEERFNRIKHSAGFPLEAVRYCLRQGGVDLRQVDAVAVGMKPIENVQDEVLQILSGRPNYSRQIQKRMDAAARFRDVRALLAREFGYSKDQVPRLEELSHHHAQAASAYHGSGFDDAALLSVGAFGDFVSTLLGRVKDGQVEVLEVVRFPHSLGVFYSMVGQFLGFSKYGDEGKLMGLAALGEPVYKERLAKVVKLIEDGLFELEPSYFTHPVYGLDMIWEDRVPHVEDNFSQRMIDDFGPPRHRYAPITPRDRDLAASTQAVLEDALLHVARRLRRLVPGTKSLCYSGGVALNCMANVALQRSGLFEKIYIPPAPTDAGTAIGAALAIARKLNPQAPRVRLDTAQLGPAYTAAEIERALEGSGLSYVRSPRVHEEVADLVAQGKVVGWFRGRMEFGPRALGGRSILGDPRRQDMREIMNNRVKFREASRPFAASILAERQQDYLTVDWASPFMSYAAPVRAEKRAEIPAVVHADGTCRYQSVSAEASPDLHRVISAFAAKTGVPLLLNTSFNENEPIVCSAEDAIECFVSAKIDALVLEDFLVRR
jgi:carbamoyltransferase